MSCSSSAVVTLFLSLLARRERNATFPRTYPIQGTNLSSSAANSSDRLVSFRKIGAPKTGQVPVQIDSRYSASRSNGTWRNCDLLLALVTFNLKGLSRLCASYRARWPSLAHCLQYGRNLPERSLRFGKSSSGSVFRQHWHTACDGAPTFIGDARIGLSPCVRGIPR